MEGRRPMSNGPGPPISPRGDSEPYEPLPPFDPYRRGDTEPEPEDGPASWRQPEGWSAGRRQPEPGPARRPAPRPAAPDYGSRRQDGTAATRGQTPQSLAPLAGLRPATAAGTEIRRHQDTMKLGIWGSPASGKSTFLAALQHATLNAHRSLGQWHLYPSPGPSAALLAQWNYELVSERKFPEPTALGARTELRWSFEGDLTGSRYQSPWRRLRQMPDSSAFDLDIIDVNGEVFGPRPTDREVPQAVVDQTLRHLADAQGLIFLFDPITERDEPSVERYLNRPLADLLGLVKSRGRTVRSRLPHCISVCITKFDEPRLFQRACEAGFVNTGRDGMPRVLGKHAGLFFDALCDGVFWPDPDPRGPQGPRWVRDMLYQYFDPGRIRYYVTSSIGFNLGNDGQFDPKNYIMVREEDSDGKPIKRINGSIRPINVLEPLVELHMQLRWGR